MNPRVLIAGLFHETHTFLGTTTPWSDFAVVRGKDLLARIGDGSPLDGVLTVARDCGWDVVPALDARAVPSGTVEDAAFEAFWSELEPVLRTELSGQRLDALFLVLHGAMATQSIPDAEGELLDRVRKLPGGERPLIFAVLDLHANVSARMCRLLNGWAAYRCNPHTDAKEAAERAARLLDRALREKARPQAAWGGVPVIWAPPGTGTASDPMKSLLEYTARRERENPRIWAFNVIAGFSFADTADTGVSLSLVTADPGPWVQEELHEAARLAWNLRAAGLVEYPSADSVAARLGDTEGPVLLVEPADNIGGGAPGDGTGVLRAMLRHRLRRCLVALNDPEAVRELAQAALGSRVHVRVGGKSWPDDEGPVALDAELVSRSDGHFRLEDPHSHLASMSGLEYDMGPCAVLRAGGPEGTTVLLTSRKTPPFDLGQFRSQGIEPKRFAVIGVKAAVAHRRAYDPIIRGSHFVATPGPCGSDLTAFRYRRLRRPIWPLDPVAEPHFRFA